MIQYTDVRTKPEGGVYPSSRTMKPSKAINILVNCELAFGGQIVDITSTRVETRTVVLGCVDQSVFEGSPEEMEYLVKMATATNEVRLQRSERPRPEDDGGPNDIRRLMMALSDATSSVKVAAIATLGDLNGLEMLSRVSTMHLEDITSVIGLIADGEATREEAFSLI